MDQERSRAGLKSADSGIFIKTSPFLAEEGFGSSPWFSFAIVASDKSQSAAMAIASLYVFPWVTSSLQ